MRTGRRSINWTDKAATAETAQAETPSRRRQFSTQHVGLWVEGVDRLGAKYEGIWRVIKRFLSASSATQVRFSIVAHARFREELLEFVSELPESVRDRVQVRSYGEVGAPFEKGEAERQARSGQQVAVDAWLVPNPMWAAAQHLGGPKVVWFHDFLLAEFPQSYPRALFHAFEHNVHAFDDAGAFFVFTSPYVMREHGERICGISPSKSKLIVNPPVEPLPEGCQFPEGRRAGGDLIRDELRRDLKNFMSRQHAELFFDHITSFPFEDLPYFFVSSQNREHKAFLRVAETVRDLIRRRFLPYPVFTTAFVDVNGKTPLERFLQKELMMGDFMSVGKVGDLVHALLYKYARLTIHPSTFEGNLPLPFAESVALGTPCVVPYSRAYVEFVEEALHPWIFYNPTEAGLTDKIIDIERRRPDYVHAQRQILQTLQLNTVEQFFSDHMEALDRAATVQPRKVQNSNVSLSAKRWPSFTFGGGSGSDDERLGDGLLWAEYLGNDGPSETCLVMSLSGVDGIGLKEKVDLTAELGAWVEDDYVVCDAQPLVFSPARSLPAPLSRALDVANTPLPRTPSDRIACVRLRWDRGSSPELRISGKRPVQPVRAQLVCLGGSGLALLDLIGERPASVTPLKAKT